MFFVHTLDASGQPAVGHGVRDLIQRQPVAAADLLHDRPGRHPGARRRPCYVRQGSTDTAVTVRTWDPQYDLALLVLPRVG